MDCMTEMTANLILSELPYYDNINQSLLRLDIAKTKQELLARS